MRQLISAAKYYHSQGVAHRSIKAENVLISKDGESVYLTGFGQVYRGPITHFRKFQLPEALF